MSACAGTVTSERQSAERAKTIVRMRAMLPEDDAERGHPEESDLVAGLAALVAARRRRR